ncbi:holin [Achromobacter denitrificans]|uniref:holin n=1 Tax=Achromobacter denitrificans TaxID=32002 RepID=UPI0027A68E36|nr:holin [Achromobacter denitrificans]
MPQRIKGMKLDDAAILAANRTTEAGAVTGVVGWAAQVNWIGWAGVLVAVVGLLANLYYQRRRDRREQAESEARMAALRERCGL